MINFSRKQLIKLLNFIVQTYGDVIIIIQFPIFFFRQKEKREYNTAYVNVQHSS